MLKCEGCGYESSYEDEVCYYDSNGYISGDLDGTERAHCLCNNCADSFFAISYSEFMYSERPEVV